MRRLRDESSTSAAPYPKIACIAKRTRKVDNIVMNAFNVMRTARGALVKRKSCKPIATRAVIVVTMDCSKNAERNVVPRHCIFLRQSNKKSALIF